MVAPLENTGIQTAKYCNVAGLGVLIFDYFLMLKPEIRWTWNRRWNVARVLFVILCYMAFVAAGMTSYAILATRANENDDKYSARTSAGLQMVIDILNIQRLVTDFTTAIHIISIVAAEEQEALAVLLVLAAICIACGVGLTDFVGSLLVVPVNPSDDKCAFQVPPISNCTFQVNPGSAIQYGFLIAYELLLLSLMVFKRYKDYRDYNSRLMRVVFQGGMRYMTAMICVVTFFQFNMSRAEALVAVVSVANIVITSAVPISYYSEMMDLPQVVLHTQQDQRPTSFD
ncbi:uncharacterized protein HD556DRAFT_1306194 [Suillus plorans]|uniref:DUF6533 domain-containing protein n=1 Tax=Suillus plorans TaxID=116603 RepID=A0A9P7DM16_9AGAM|nr:uncharacterized protein HD556DRAFT_1306194 [Suillus plorans]KAG1798153.1 hypothetical protein HD556DRAFT_1306194 [Suillus plorans]